MRDSVSHEFSRACASAKRTGHSTQTRLELIELVAVRQQRVGDDEVEAQYRDRPQRKDEDHEDRHHRDEKRDTDAQRESVGVAREDQRADNCCTRPAINQNQPQPVTLIPKYSSVAREVNVSSSATAASPLKPGRYYVSALAFKASNSS